MKEETIISIVQAVAMLPDSDTIHTMENPAINVMVGADWSKTDLLNVIMESDKICLAGPIATGMGHGLAIDYKGAWLYIETKKDKTA